MKGSKSGLERVTAETLNINRNGGYVNCDFSAQLNYSIEFTRCISPKESLSLLQHTPPPPPKPEPMKVQVTNEKSQEAAYRLLHVLKVSEVVLLNFASAKNRGGGFLRGAKAQEEDLCRSSSLFSCLNTPRCDAYYEINSLSRSTVYTDTIIYSPSVPFFRSRSLDLLDAPFFPAVISCPAPNATAMTSKNGLSCNAELENVIRKRAGKILAVCEAQGHRNLILGAWGCGVFGNEPFQVADAFGTWLESERFRHSFDLVVFPVYTSAMNPNLIDPFQQRFSQSA